MATVTSSTFTVIVNKSAYIDTSAIKVVRGTAELIAVDSNPTTGQFSFSITSCTGCSAVKADVDTVGIVSVTADVSTVEISINAENVKTYTRQITVAKVKQGEQGMQGATGEKGQSLTKSTPQWYASTSNTTQTGGSWVENMPTIDSSHYLWLRYKLNWENPAATTYTTPTLEQIAENVKKVSAKQSEFQQDLDGFKTTVSNTYQTKDGMNNYATKSQLQQTATDLTATFNNGYSQGVTQMNADGIKVYHNNINSDSYTHISPNGFIIRYKGQDIFVCDPNGLTYKGAITGSTITGGTIKGTEVIGGSLNVEGVINAGKIICQDIESSRYQATLTGDIDLYVNSTTGNDDNEARNDVRFKTLQGAIDAMPKFLNGKTVHIIMETNSTENVYIKGVVGGSVRIFMNGKTLFGTFRTYVCSAAINVYGGTKSNNEGATGVIHPKVGLSFGGRAVSVGFEASQYGTLHKIKVFAPDTIPSGVSSTEKVCVAAQSGTGSVYCKNVHIVNAVTGFRANNAGVIHMSSSSGVASKYGFQAVTGGIISVANQNQSGGVEANVNKSDGGQVWYEVGKCSFEAGNPTKEDSSAPVVNTNVSTFKSSYGDSYLAEEASWKGDSTVRQGDFEGYNGCWFFGTAFNEAVGRTISKVEITMYRQTGGYMSAIPLQVKTHGYTDRPSGAPSYGDDAGTLSLEVGLSGTLTITDSTILNKISSGEVKGFGLKAAYQQKYFAICSGSCTVKITYSD